MSPGKRLVTKLVLLLVALGVSLASAEAALRVTISERAAAGGYWGRGAFEEFAPSGYRHSPGFEGRAVREDAFDCAVRIDSLGLRQDDRDAQMAFERRLLLLGDSFPFGLGVDVEKGIGSLLRGPLNERRIGVVNGAQTGYCTSQAVAFGRSLWPQVRPDLVVLTVFLDNDLEGEFFGDWRDVDVASGYRLRGDRWARIAAVDALRTRTRLGLLTDARIGRLRERWLRRKFYGAGVADQQGIVELVVRPILELQAECRRRGAAFGVVMIPERNGGTRFDETFRARLADSGIPFLDLAGAVAPEHYFRTDGHWNTEGHLAAARAVAAFLDEKLLGSPAGGDEAGARGPEARSTPATS